LIPRCGGRSILVAPMGIKAWNNAGAGINARVLAL